MKHMQRVPYALAIGSIMYAVRCTRLDIAFTQNLCSRFQHNPCEVHWTTIKNILKYLRNTKDMVLGVLRKTCKLQPESYIAMTAGCVVSGLIRERSRRYMKLVSFAAAERVNRSSLVRKFIEYG
ncbi:hypothetical protein Tco_0939469 [Tanacetum coccineum]|uniref:Uncharacterized protein n=1 Tax=Tanacetum coccineum TaxID=301880 RepID=A0ABQ5DKV9_9ASTR